MGKQIRYYMTREDFNSFFEYFGKLNLLIYDFYESRYIKETDYSDKLFYQFYLIDPAVHHGDETLERFNKRPTTFDYIKDALEICVSIIDGSKPRKPGRMWIDESHYREVEDYLYLCYKKIAKYIKQHSTYHKALLDYIFEGVIKQYSDLSKVIHFYNEALEDHSRRIQEKNKE